MNTVERLLGISESTAVSRIIRVFECTRDGMGISLVGGSDFEHLRCIYHALADQKVLRFVVVCFVRGMVDYDKKGGYDGPLGGLISHCLQNYGDVRDMFAEIVDQYENTIGKDDTVAWLSTLISILYAFLVLADCGIHIADTGNVVQVDFGGVDRGSC